MSKDAHGDRMKKYELANQRVLMPLLPVMARIDGHCFHTFTRGLDRPFDLNLSRAMIETTKYLVKKTHALIGYTQSDEITLLWCLPPDSTNSQMLFDGRVDKMNSIIAAWASSKFARLVSVLLPKKADKDIAFDCRTWNLPNRQEAINTLIWREDDATRNSVSMAAQSCASYSELFKKNRAAKMDLLMANGINWNDYPAHFKRGTYVRREVIEREISETTLALLPKKHTARVTGCRIIKRNVIAEMIMPPIRRIANAEEVIFDGAQPITKEKES